MRKKLIMIEFLNIVDNFKYGKKINLINIYSESYQATYNILLLMFYPLVQLIPFLKKKKKKSPAFLCPYQHTAT